MPRRVTPWARFVSAAALTVAAFGFESQAHALSRFLELPPREEAINSAAYRYANMSNEEAFAELDRRGVPYVKVAPIGTVRAPIRLKGRLHGVDIHSALPPEQRKESAFEVLDARLALALDDFSVILARHDVVELVHYTMYRPNVPPPGAAPAQAAAEEKPTKGNKTAKAAPEKKDNAAPANRAPAKRRANLDGKAAKSGKPAGRATSGRTGKKELEHELDKELVQLDAEIAVASPAGGKTAPAKAAPKQAAPRKPPPQRPGKLGKSRSAKKVLPKSEEHVHGKYAPPGTRHPAGLAIDVGVLRKQDGSMLSVAAHFQGKIGDRTCGEGAREPEASEAKELRSIVCQARDSGVFTYALTPNFDADHFDHFHMEIKPQVEWFLYH